jgi:hypothetical protein
MIISHKHKFIFLKTRKTAGSSIEKYLYRYLGPDDICTGSPRDGTPRLNAPTDDGHVSWKYIKNNFSFEWQNYYKFAVERNPWDKVVSYYYWYQKIKPGKVKNGFYYFLKDTKFASLNDWKLYTNNNTIVVDDLIPYEKLHSKLHKIQIPYNNELLTTFVKNETRKNKDYKELYNPITADIVRQNFLNVIEHFEYKF